jgi:cation:H+ antiporter
MVALDTAPTLWTWVSGALAAVVSLGASALVVSRLERVAARLGLREATLGLLAALAADGPEITTALSGLLRGERAIGVGVVVGSNAFNLAAALGLPALSAGHLHFHRDVVVLTGSAGVVLALVTVGASTGTLGPAIALVVAAPVFLLYLAVSSVHPATLGRWPLPRRFGASLARAVLDEEAELAVALDPVPGGVADAVVAVLALAAVVGASTVLEQRAGALGAHYRVPGILVGGVVLAAVTSLPNALSALRLAHRGRGSAVLSIALNSNALNLCAGLLVPALFVGLRAYGSSGVLVAAWSAALTVGTLLLAFWARGLTRGAGAVVVVGYLALVAVLAWP